MNSSKVFESARRMKNVMRLSGTPTLMRQDLASHCYFTGLLFMYVAEKEKVPYDITDLEFVFLHDILETYTGDLLWPAKHMGGNDKLWDVVEDTVVEEGAPHLRPYVDKALEGAALELFRACDTLELAYCCRDELEVGNISAAMKAVRVNVHKLLSGSRFATIREMYEELGI